MSLPFKIGVLQLSMEPLDETVHMAQACDAAGFDVFWLAEAYPWWRKHSMEARSSTAATAIIARETKRIVIAWGIISPYTRHPVQIAMEARILQEAAGEGRRTGHRDARKHRDYQGHALRQRGEVSRQSVSGLCTGPEIRRARAALAAADLRWRHRPGPAAARWRHDAGLAHRKHHHAEICQVFAQSHGGWREEGRPRRLSARSWLCGDWQRRRRSKNRS